MANEKSRIEELEERIREHEDAIRLKDEELIKSRDRIYDLERDVDQAGEVELLKNEQLTRVNFWTATPLKIALDLKHILRYTKIVLTTNSRILLG